ncbi:DUF3263 domain-containing protein [Corynebacterium pelargi]|uniref:Uncharacterized protein n=1 Tax=Corynebacterium pelargi TaxID=1471400 RepID=A0A410W6K9_9CORY|nr:DUF3263 domain-containing protein [Corynebacterium pelargi]QAU51605.1 hypothetical protein CPELA_01530 [Corynebacterium pelargi]GGG79965.1 hypothetical protein GCM10007338_17970 [Corynebacterium pelargi]
MPYSVGMSEAELIQHQLALLEFEAQAPRSAGAKEDAIVATFGISPIRYYQQLNVAIDQPAVMQRFPSLSARLRRIRDTRANARMNKRD